MAEEAADAAAKAKDRDGTNASESSGSPNDTPKTQDSVVVVSHEKKQDVPPVDGPPPPSWPAAKANEESDGATSDSPVED